VTAKQILSPVILAVLGMGAVGGWPRVLAAPQAGAGVAAIAACDLEALSRSESEFQRLVALRRFDPTAVSAEDLRAASTAYIVGAEACYQELYGSVTEKIDDGGIWFTPDGSAPYNMFGTKWGAGSPFMGGTNTAGPRIAGGTVSYSYMANGVDMTPETLSAGSNVAISSLPTFSACFLTEISNAFAAWSAVANIQFVQVADNGLPFNQAGATGDIRIGAHTIDAVLGVLAHGFYPPPNGTSAAGDVHFDRLENWSCAPGMGLFDVGIVAAHEIGHAIGLGHEFTLTALMNPFYNPAITMPLADDINGATNIYGSPVVPVIPTPTVTTVRDYEGDGSADITVYRRSTGGWFARRSSDGQLFNVLWGAASLQDRPVPADYDGDGKADVAVYRQATGEWFVRRSTNGTLLQLGWGAPALGDVPVPADYDGDDKADIGVYRGTTGQWFIQRSTNGTLLQLGWGAPSLGDVPVPADYDNDDKADIGVYRGTTGEWFIQRSTNGTLMYLGWGAPSLGDVPVPADYDGDGKADIGVYRDTTGEWFIQRSTNGTLMYLSWGAPSLGDTVR
jgi:hypothetical protein